MNATEKTWILQASQGDRQAFACLLDLHWDPVCRFLHGMSGSSHSAEDAAQEAFCKAWAKLPTLATPETFRVWLFTIARRCWLDGRRRAKHEATQPIPAESVGSGNDPLRAAMEREAFGDLRKAIALLPGKYREAYLLWMQDGTPYSEMASILSVSEETVRWRVCKARQFLVQHLKAHLPNSP